MPRSLLLLRHPVAGYAYPTHWPIIGQVLQTGATQHQLNSGGPCRRSDATVDAGPSQGRPSNSMNADEPIDLGELLAQVASESSALLSASIERVNTLAHTGRIDRAGLRALREELDRARRAGMLGQQISRIGTSRVRIYEEKVDLSAMLRDALLQRRRELEHKGIEVQQQLSPLVVVGDVTIIFAMLGALLDWCQDHAQGRLDIALELKTWPAHGFLNCAFVPRSGENLGASAAPAAPASLPPRTTQASSLPAPAAKTLAWRLVEVCARKLELTLERHDTGGRTVVEMGFPKTVLTAAAMDTLLDATLEEQPSRLNSRPLAGSHVLVLCARRDLRVEVREAVQSMGLMLDFVGNVDEAREFCLGGLPHAIVYEAPQGGAALHRLMAELRAATPGIVFVEIAESGKPVQVNNVGGHELSCVARTALREALPSVLTFELSRGDTAA